MASKRFALAVPVVLAVLAIIAAPAAADDHQSGEMSADTATGPDPAKVDPDHYKVVFENDQVRVLRITYGPHEKSVMHYHPAGVAYFVTAGKALMTLPDGSSEVMEFPQGLVVEAPAGQHQPENITDQPFEVIQVELKGGGAAADEAAIAEVLQMEASGVSSGDPAMAVGAYSDDIVLMPPGEPAIEGKDAVRAWMAAMYEQFEVTVEYSFSEVEVVGDWAVERYAGRATFSPKGGGDAMSEELKGLHVYRRGADGSWRIAQDIWNADTPPAME